MEILVAAVVMLPLLVLMICVLLKKKRHPESVEENGNSHVLLPLMGMLVILSGLFVRVDTGPRLMFDLAFALLPATLSVFQIFEELNHKSVTVGFCLASVALTLMHLASAAGWIEPAPPALFVWSSIVLAFAICFIVITKTFIRILNIRKMMNQGNVWAYVWLCMDCIYLVLVASVLMVTMIFCDALDLYKGLHLSTANVVLGMAFSALCFRRLRKSPFIVFRNHERVLLESIKESRFELFDTNTPDDSGYRAVYDRIIEYFESEKPFLRSNLTINDLVSVIYSNKLYISRAISLCTGRNFRQFVNYYRIQHSCIVYRENPSMKIVELAQACGFNTVASFNMAFRLFMNETPGEWCRREKVKLVAVGK